MHLLEVFAFTCLLHKQYICTYIFVYFLYNIDILVTILKNEDKHGIAPSSLLILLFQSSSRTQVLNKQIVMNGKINPLPESLQNIPLI